MVGGDDFDRLAGDAGDDVLQAGAGSDELKGGTGNDSLDGGAGNDTYFFSLGDGQDVIAEAAPDALLGKLNTLALAHGIAEADVKVKKVGVDLEVLVGTGTDKVTVKSFFAGTGTSNQNNPIQRIYFEGANKTWDLAKIEGLVSGSSTPPQLVNPL